MVTRTIAALLITLAFILPTKSTAGTGYYEAEITIKTDTSKLPQGYSLVAEYIDPSGQTLSYKSVAVPGNLVVRLDLYITGSSLPANLTVPFRVLEKNLGLAIPGPEVTLTIPMNRLVKVDYTFFYRRITKAIFNFTGQYRPSVWSSSPMLDCIGTTCLGMDRDFRNPLDLYLWENLDGFASPDLDYTVQNWTNDVYGVKLGTGPFKNAECEVTQLYLEDARLFTPTIIAVPALCKNLAMKRDETALVYFKRDGKGFKMESYVTWAANWLPDQIKDLFRPVRAFDGTRLLVTFQANSRSRDPFNDAYRSALVTPQSGGIQVLEGTHAVGVTSIPSTLPGVFWKRGDGRLEGAIMSSTDGSPFPQSALPKHGDDDLRLFDARGDYLAGYTVSHDNKYRAAIWLKGGDRPLTLPLVPPAAENLTSSAHYTGDMVLGSVAVDLGERGARWTDSVYANSFLWRSDDLGKPLSFSDWFDNINISNVTANGSKKVIGGCWMIYSKRVLSKVGGKPYLMLVANCPETSFASNTYFITTNDMAIRTVTGMVVYLPLDGGPAPTPPRPTPTATPTPTMTSTPVPVPIPPSTPPRAPSVAPAPPVVVVVPTTVSKNEPCTCGKAWVTGVVSMQCVTFHSSGTLNLTTPVDKKGRQAETMQSTGNETYDDACNRICTTTPNRLMNEAFCKSGGGPTRNPTPSPTPTATPTPTKVPPPPVVSAPPVASGPCTCGKAWVQGLNSQQCVTFHSSGTLAVALELNKPFDKKGRQAKTLSRSSDETEDMACSRICTATPNELMNEPFCKAPVR